MAAAERWRMGGRPATSRLAALREPSPDVCGRRRATTTAGSRSPACSPFHACASCATPSWARSRTCSLRRPSSRSRTTRASSARCSARPPHQVPHAPHLRSSVSRHTPVHAPRERWGAREAPPDFRSEPVCPPARASTLVGQPCRAARASAHDCRASAGRRQPRLRPRATRRLGCRLSARGAQAGRYRRAAAAADLPSAPGVAPTSRQAHRCAHARRLEGAPPPVLRAGGHSPSLPTLRRAVLSLSHPQHRSSSPCPPTARGSSASRPRPRSGSSPRASSRPAPPPPRRALLPRRAPMAPRATFR